MQNPQMLNFTITNLVKKIFRIFTAP